MHVCIETHWCIGSGIIPSLLARNSEASKVARGELFELGD